MTARALALQCLACLALLIAVRLILGGDAFVHSWLILAVLIYLGRRIVAFLYAGVYPVTGGKTMAGCKTPCKSPKRPLTKRMKKRRTAIVCGQGLYNKREGKQFAGMIAACGGQYGGKRMAPAGNFKLFPAQRGRR